MGAPGKHRKLEILERRAKVAAMWKRGDLTQSEIAERLRAEGHQVHQPDVSKDLAAIRKQLHAETVHDAAAALEDEIQRLEYIYARALEGLDRSQQPTVITEASTDGSASGRAKRKTQTNAGSPEFLNTALRARERIQKLRGMEPVTKTAITDSKGNDLPDLQAARATINESLELLRRRGSAPPEDGHSGNGHANGSPLAGRLPPSSAN